jgi:hypothetical protein
LVWYTFSGIAEDSKYATKTRITTHPITMYYHCNTNPS